MRVATKMTVDEFLREYADVDDGNLYELQDGEVLVSPPPLSAHGELHAVVIYLLGLYRRSHRGMRIFDASAVELSDDTLRGPDVSIMLPRDKVRFVKGRMAGVPSLIVEIVSPSKPRLDLIVKRGLYTSKGVGEVWFFDTDSKEALFLVKSAGGGYTERRMSSGIFESRFLRGFRIDIAALFALDVERLERVLEKRE